MAVRQQYFLEHTTPSIATITWREDAQECCRWPYPEKYNRIRWNPIDRSPGWDPMVSIAPAAYPDHTDAPIRFLPVTRDEAPRILRTSAVDSDTAGYSPLTDAGHEGAIADETRKVHPSGAYVHGEHTSTCVQQFRNAFVDPIYGVVGHDTDNGGFRSLPIWRSSRETQWTSTTDVAIHRSRRTRPAFARAFAHES